MKKAAGHMELTTADSQNWRKYENGSPAKTGAAVFNSPYIFIIRRKRLLVKRKSSTNVDKIVVRDAAENYLTVTL